jgi:hypothetical protein
MGDVNEEMKPQEGVVPAVCEEGCVSWPARYVTVRDQGAYLSLAGMKAGTCPACGKPRAILPGEYRAGDDGLVTRAELTA